MGKTLTTIVSFGSAGSSSSADVTAEIDGIMHLDSNSNERSSFLPGEEVYFLLYYDKTKVKILQTYSTDDGEVTYIGPVTRTRKQELSFQYTGHKLDLSYKPSSPLTATWNVRTSNLTVSDKTVTADAPPCLGEVSYSVAFEQYLHKPSQEAAYLTDIVVEYELIG